MKIVMKICQFAVTFLLLAWPTASGAQGHLSLNQNQTNFTYTIWNDEPAGSKLFLSNFHLEANAPFQVVASPAGWNFVTDNFSAVDWYCTDSVSPYPHDVAPGTSLSGFVISSVVTNSESLPYALVTWLHDGAESGPAVQGSVAAPSAQLAHADALLTDLFFSAPNEFRFTLTGVPGLAYAVETSSDLKDWTEMIRDISPFTIREAVSSGSPEKFYRAAPLFDPSSMSQD